jgi:hypothetical protein
MNEDLIARLLKRAEIRRQIPTRKSVQEGAPDRIADLLEEAAAALIKTEKEANKAYHIGYDAFFDKHTGEWIESKCDDPTCSFCMKRPNNVYAIKEE